METEETVVEPQVESEESTEETTQEVVTEAPEIDREAEARRQLTARAKAAEAKAKQLEAQLKQVRSGSSPLDVEDYIDISTSLDGLDARQKAFLAEQHKLSGKSLKEIRNSEDFQLWNEAYSLRQQKEAALRPNSAQEDEPAPQPFAAKLKGASLAEKEAMLRAQGLYRDRRPQQNRVDIGQKISTQ